MSWNEPGGDKGNGRDPWRRQEGPPDLDEAFKKLFQKVFGGGGQQGRGQSGSSFGIGLIVAVIAIVYALAGIYIVHPAEQAVVTQFGKYVETVGPGPHWLPLGVQAKTILDTKQVFNTRHGGQMLTKDENIVSVEIAVQYRISDPKEFLFNVVDPRHSLQQATESALRTVIGHSNMDYILTSGRADISEKIRVQVEDMMERYASGLYVTDIAMQPARAPEEVKDAFDDVIKAREDEVRFVNEAEAYANKIEPVARGNAQRLLEEARGYQRQEVLLAKGNIAKFEALLPEYKRAPKVTRERMYLATMSELYGGLKKVVVNTDSGNLLYLPIDKLLSQGSKTAASNPLPLEKVALNDIADEVISHPARERSRDRWQRGRRGRGE